MDVVYDVRVVNFEGIACHVMSSQCILLAGVGFKLGPSHVRVRVQFA
jgi:hypothetical protein